MAINLACRTMEGDEITTTASDVSAYPNPASGTINVSFDTPAKEKYTIKIADLSGKILLQQENNSSEGANSLPIDVSHLAKGIYFLKLELQGIKAQTIRIAVQ